MAGKGGLEQLFLLAQKAANIVLLAVVLIWLGLRFVNSAALEGWVAQTAPDYPVVNNVGTAVWVTAVNPINAQRISGRCPANCGIKYKPASSAK